MGEKGIFFNHTFQSAAAATGNGTAMDVDGLSLVGLQITGTFSATVTIEGSVDGTNYVAIRSLNLNTGAVASAPTAAGVFQVPVSGLAKLRARVSAYTSGTVTVTGRGVFGAPGFALTS